MIRFYIKKTCIIWQEIYLVFLKKLKECFIFYQLTINLKRVDMLKNGTIFEISTFKVDNFFISRHIFIKIDLISEVNIEVSKKSIRKNLQWFFFFKMLFCCLAEKRDYSSQTRAKQTLKPGLV